jgi:NAD(P)-dependent dehydrogenase (short-subunit alcohol dehydrogenase family)
MKQGVQIFSLEGKTALVTGATGHLGEAMAYILAEAGAHVLINSRSSERGASLAAALTAAGHSAEAAIFDVTSPDAVSGFISNYGCRPLHIIINNAYVGGARSIELSSETLFNESYDVSVVAAHRIFTMCLQNLRLAVKNSGGASVINLASMYALVSPDQRIYDSASQVNPPFYGASKAALLQFTRYAACEFGGEGIRVNAISPGPFPSALVQTTSPQFIDSLIKKVPMGHIGSPEEIKGPVLFLASEASSYVNGANIVVDGGWTCW